MEIFLVRHGEIDSNVKKIYSGRSQEVLNEKGRNQAIAVGQELLPISIQAIYCGPLPRVKETAVCLAEATCLDVNVLEEFNEMKMGPWEGWSEVSVKEAFPKEWELWNKQPSRLRISGRETLDELQHRGLEGVKKVMSQSYGKNRICIVSHVAVIRVLILFSQKRSLDDYRKIEVPNAKPIKIRHDEY